MFATYQGRREVRAASIPSNTEVQSSELLGLKFTHADGWLGIEPEFHVPIPSATKQRNLPI